MLLVSDGGQPSVFADLLGPLTVVAVLLVAWAFMTPASRPATWRGPLGALARTGYDRWRAMHGVLAVFLLAAMVHGLIDSASLRTLPVLLVLYVGVCVTGLYAVGERLVIARLGVRAVQGEVVAVDRSDARTAVISILPARPVTHEAGQFVELGAPVSGERPHPFTVTSAPGARHVQVAVRASGAGTHGIVQKVAVGDRVTLGAARGLFRHPDVGPRQVWVAGGIGIAPFVSWVRAQGERHPGHQVDLLWSDRGFEGAPFVAELRAAAQRFDWLRLHLHDTTRSARLTAADVVSAGGGDVDVITVLACGAPAMVKTLAAGLSTAGLPRARLGTEAYSYR
jgi:predicted ferric reductase